MKTQENRKNSFLIIINFCNCVCNFDRCILLVIIKIAVMFFLKHPICAWKCF